MVQHFCTAFTRAVHQHRILPHSQIMVLQCVEKTTADEIEIDVLRKQVDDNTAQSNSAFIENVEAEMVTDANMQDSASDGESPIKPRRLFDDNPTHTTNDDVILDDADEYNISLIDKC
jgi:hypothetical protein